jgi:hypothetical protein
MTKKFWFTALALFALSMLTDFLLHGLVLHADYAQLPNLMRTEADSQKYFHWMLLAHVFFALAFVWIYQRGREAKPWLGQGIRFGLAVAILAVVPGYLIYYVVQPLPGLLIVKQVGFDLVRMAGLGLCVGWAYR